MSNQRDVLACKTLPLGNEPALWAATRRGELPARERLIEAYLPYARILAAGVFAGRIADDIEFAEYLQFASLALIEAVDRYNPAYQSLFTSFAYERIRGAILNGIAHLTEKRTQLATRKQLLRERQNTLLAAQELDGKEVFHQLAEVAISLALGYILDDAACHQHDATTTLQHQYTGLELQQLRERMRAMVDTLPHKARLVIKYHYLNQLSFEYIAETMALSRSRIAQLHGQALKQLRENAKSIKACDVAW